MLCVSHKHSTDRRYSIHTLQYNTTFHVFLHRAMPRAPFEQRISPRNIALEHTDTNVTAVIGRSNQVDTHVSADRKRERGSQSHHSDTVHEGAHGQLSCASRARDVDSHHIRGCQLCNKTLLNPFQTETRENYVPMSPAARYPSRRSFFVLEVTTTTPFAFAHARRTCSGFTLRRAAIAPTGLSSGPPGWCVSGMSTLYASLTIPCAFPKAMIGSCCACT